MTSTVHTATRRFHEANAGPARILVVDDQPANIQVLGAILGKLGHDIVPASDGATALKRLALRPPDLILLDLLMPDMDGCEVCRRLRNTPEGRDIPVIFLSAADDKTLIVRALESGGVDYITKPFNQAELVSRVQTQLSLKYTRDQLINVAEDKDELLGILTHDLKSHLGGMQMSARLLLDMVSRAHDDRSAQIAENLFHTSSQLLAFVKEFLANAAADHGITLQPARVDLSQAIIAAVHQHEESARRKRLEIRTIMPSGALFVLADPSALSQILDNLLSNAVKFSPPDKLIRVVVQPGRTVMQFRVQDEGPGFTAEDQMHMFRRYRRLSARPTGGEPSTGLGLSIVRKLVQALQGEVICETVPGQGASFIVRLPRSSS